MREWRIGVEDEGVGMQGESGGWESGGQESEGDGVGRVGEEGERNGG